MSRSQGFGTKTVAPEFVVTPQLLDAVSPAGDRGGIVIGADQQNSPLNVSLVRSRPTRIAVVGPLYLAKMLALRALGTGAWIVVATARPGAWTVLQQATGAPPNSPLSQHVQIRRLAPTELPRPSEDRPILVIHDGGPTPQELFPPRSPWHTTMYVLPYLHPQIEPIARQSDLVFTQRIPPGQAQLAQRFWNLPPQTFGALTGIKDDQVITLGLNNLWRIVRLVTGPKETQILGPIRRAD
jgi:hypothetical protein